MNTSEIVTQALQALGVVAETESASAEQVATGLTMLNNMMADMAGDGVNVGFVAQSDPSADVGIGMEYRLALVNILAVYLSSVYTKPVPPVVASLATMGRSRLIRDSIYQNRDPSTMTHIPLGTGWRWRYWDISQGP